MEGKHIILIILAVFVIDLFGIYNIPVVHDINQKYVKPLLGQDSSTSSVEQYEKLPISSKSIAFVFYDTDGAKYYVKYPANIPPDLPRADIDKVEFTVFPNTPNIKMVTIIQGYVMTLPDPEKAFGNECQDWPNIKKYREAYMISKGVIVNETKIRFKVAGNGEEYHSVGSVDKVVSEYTHGEDKTGEKAGSMIIDILFEDEGNNGYDKCVETLANEIKVKVYTYVVFTMEDGSSVVAYKYSATKSIYERIEEALSSFGNQFG